MTATLLIELLFEEVPHDTLISMYHEFPPRLHSALQKRGFMLNEQSLVQAYATPRRLAVLCSPVLEHSLSKEETLKLMPVEYGQQSDHSWTPALLKKIDKLGLSEQERNSITEHNGLLVYTRRKAAKHVQEILGPMLKELLLTLTTKNRMYWAYRQGPLIRPLKHILALLDDQILPCTLWDATSSRMLYGHRTLSPQPIPLARAQLYIETLTTHGHVIASPEKRRQHIETGIRDCIAHSEIAEIHYLPDAALLDEIIYLVEYPLVLLCHFPPSFLQLPESCLTLVLKKSQRYIPLYDANSRLINAFLVVANMATDPEGAIARGAEKVVVARLSDALFFLTQDEQTTLKERLPDLRKVCYHDKLGSLYDLQTRITKIAQLLGSILALSSEEKVHISEACFLLKTDLVTHMVKEFPELQGLMGRFYAEKEGYSPVVCTAIEEHYHPLNKDSALPTHPVSLCVAIAHKIEHLISFFNIQVTPTGDKDPFGLRRSAIGLMRLLNAHNITIPLRDFLYTAASVIQAPLQQSTLNALHHFLKERYFFYLQETSTYTQESIHAVLNASFDYPHLTHTQIELLEAYRQSGQADQMLSTYKRLRNLLKKERDPSQLTITVEYFCTPQEETLFASLNALHQQPEEAVDNNCCVYASTLSATHQALPVINDFLDQVMIHVENPLIKNNRIALLFCARSLLTRFIDWEAFITQ